nr:protein CROC-4 isoform X4 [Equus caballus]
MAWPEGGWEGTREKRAPASAEGGRTARERKREASEIPEWIDRCYVIGAASSTPQEARSREREAVQQQGPPSSLSSSQKPGAGHPGRSSLLCFWCHRRWPPLAFGTPNSVLEVGNPPEKQRPLCVLLYLEVILEVCTSQGLGASHLGRVGAPPPSRPLSSTRVPEPHPAPRTAPGRSQVRDWTGASDWLSLDPTPRPQLQGGPGRCYAEEEGGIQSFFEELTVQQGRQTHNYMACGDCCPEDVCKVLWEQEIP